MFLAHPALALCLLLGHAEPEPDLLSKLQAAPCLTPYCFTVHACLRNHDNRFGQVWLGLGTNASM